MKQYIWTIGGICAAVAGFLVWSSKRVTPVHELASQLEDAWADHHTSA